MNGLTLGVARACWVSRQIDMNVTMKAFRIDMDRAYPKAVNYSLVTTVICLLQIGFLFCQLHFLHRFINEP